MWVPTTLATLAAVLFNEFVGRRYLSEYLARHASVPGRDWLMTVDADPIVERWRRYRLATSALSVTLLAIMLVLVLGGT